MQSLYVRKQMPAAVCFLEPLQITVNLVQPGGSFVAIQPAGSGAGLITGTFRAKGGHVF